MVPDCSSCNIDIRVNTIYGLRDGRIHIGSNQTLYISNGRLPVDLAVYRGGEATMLGELRVTGVTVTIEGVLQNVENITIVDNGKCLVSVVLD